MTDYLDLEIAITRQGVENYTVEFRFNDPEGEIRTPQRNTVGFQFDDLRLAQINAQNYGRLLSAKLFSDQSIIQYLALARKEAQERNKLLRIRLVIDEGAPELHELRWETLRDPESGNWLLMREDILFSRLLGSRSWERLRLRAKGDLKALIAIANPVDLEQGVYEVGGVKLNSIDVAGEHQRALLGLSEITIATLESDPVKPERVTTNRLVEALRQGADILYLVCHGALLDRADPPGAYVLLEKEDGTGDLVPGARLAERIAALPSEIRPRLIVLASCQSAGAGDAAATSDATGALAALGPLLARAGVPAVVAMQGSVSMKTIAGFMPVFLHELLKHGILDRAMAAARSQVSQRSDAWMPVVFMRLRDGRPWYQPGFAAGDSKFDRWQGLMTSLKLFKCTPILGQGVTQFLTGSTMQIARLWAQESGFPLLEEERDHLPRVAQFLSNDQGSRDVPRLKLAEGVEKALCSRYNLQKGITETTDWLKAEHLEQIGRQVMNDPQANALTMLAHLPIKVYINANPDILLAAALQAVGKFPVVEYARWNPDLENLPSNLPKDEEVYQPSVQRPLVYNLYGLFSEPSSLVVSEDDYFDYLTWINRYGAKDLPMIGRVWSVNALVILGFNLYDWDFRILFRSIPVYERVGRQDTQPSVAVQIAPGEDQILPERAQQHLEKFFLGVKMGMFWGSVKDFCQALKGRCEKEGICGS